MENYKRATSEGVTFEPYKIDIIDLEKGECAYVNDTIRIRGKGYLMLYPTNVKYSVGKFIFYQKEWGTGEFVRVKDLVFIKEELVNFYV